MDKRLLPTIHRTLREHTVRPQEQDGPFDPITLLCSCSDIDDYMPDTYREHLAAQIFRAIDEMEQGNE